MKEYPLKGGTDRDVLDSRNAIIQRLIDNTYTDRGFPISPFTYVNHIPSSFTGLLQYSMYLLFCLLSLIPECTSDP